MSKFTKKYLKFGRTPGKYLDGNFSSTPGQVLYKRGMGLGTRPHKILVPFHSNNASNPLFLHTKMSIDPDKPRLQSKDNELSKKNSSSITSGTEETGAAGAESSKEIISQDGLGAIDGEGMFCHEADDEYKYDEDFDSSTDNEEEDASQNKNEECTDTVIENEKVNEKNTNVSTDVEGKGDKDSSEATNVDKTLPIEKEDQDTSRKSQERTKILENLLDNPKPVSQKRLNEMTSEITSKGKRQKKNEFKDNFNLIDTDSENEDEAE